VSDALAYAGVIGGLLIMTTILLVSDNHDRERRAEDRRRMKQAIRRLDERDTPSRRGP
jgi:hypothetical protein